MTTILKQLNRAQKIRTELLADFANVTDRLNELDYALESVKKELSYQSEILNVLTAERKKNEQFISFIVDNYLELCKLTTKKIKL